MKILQNNKTIWLVVAAILIISAVFQSLPTDWQQLLRYERANPQEWWRFATAQLIHLGWMHWILDMAGLVLIVAIFNQDWNFKGFIATLIISAIVVNAGLWWLSPEVAWYVGISGVLHGLLGAGVIFSYRNQALFSIMMGVLVVGKVIWEQVSHESIGTEALIGGNVLFDAHLYGLIGGVLAAVLCLVACRSNG